MFRDLRAQEAAAAAAEARARENYRAYYIRPEGERTISLREMARVQEIR